MILRGVPGPDRLADRNDVTGHAHRIVRNRPREADILRRLRRSDGEIPDDGRSRHIHDETAALRPFAGVADIVHSADAPGILAVVLDGQNRRNIHGGDPHRHRFAALRRITDFIPLHTEEVIRSRPAEFHLVALHRNRGRRFDVGRNRHVTDIRGHLVTDEVETFALRPEAGPVAHRVHGLHAPVDFLVLGQTADAEAVRAVQPQRLLAGDELVSPVAGELGVVRHLNDILHAAAVVREIPREGEFDPDIGHRLDNGSLTRFGRRAAEARNPASGGTFRRSRVGHLAVEGRNSGERPLRSSRVDQEFAAVDRGAVAGLIVDGDIPRVGAVFQIPQLHPLADREGQAGLVRPRFVSMQFPLLVGEGDDILLDTRIRTRRGVVQSSRPVEYQRIGLARQIIFILCLDRRRIGEFRRDIVAEPRPGDGRGFVARHVERIELILPVAVGEPSAPAQIVRHADDDLGPVALAAGKPVLKLVAKQPRTALLLFRRLPVDGDGQHGVLVAAAGPRRRDSDVSRAQSRRGIIADPLALQRFRLVADIVDSPQLPLIGAVFEQGISGPGIFLDPLREIERIARLALVRHRNIDRLPLSLALFAEADRVTAHAGTVVDRALPGQGRIHGMSIGDVRRPYPGNAFRNGFLSIQEPRRGGVVVIDLEDLSIHPVLIRENPVAVRVNPINRLNLPVEVFQVVEAGDQQRRAGDELLHIGDIIPIDRAALIFLLLEVTDHIPLEPFGILVTRLPVQPADGRLRGGAEFEIRILHLVVNIGVIDHGNVLTVTPDAGPVAAADVLTDTPFDRLPGFDVRERDAVLVPAHILDNGLAGRIAADDPVLDLIAALAAGGAPAQSHGSGILVERLGEPAELRQHARIRRKLLDGEDDLVIAVDVAIDAETVLLVGTAFRIDATGNSLILEVDDTRIPTLHVAGIELEFALALAQIDVVQVDGEVHGRVEVDVADQNRLIFQAADYSHAVHRKIVQHELDVIRTESGIQISLHTGIAVDHSRILTVVKLNRSDNMRPGRNFHPVIRIVAGDTDISGMVSSGKHGILVRNHIAGNTDIHILAGTAHDAD